MKHHIQKAKEMFDAKIVYNVVIGILITMFIVKVLALIGFALGMGPSNQWERRGMLHDGPRGGMMAPDLR